MSTTEWVLVALVILIPAIVATGVTLWTLEQALKRQKKNRKKPAGADQANPDFQSPDPVP
jgi:hypothetical protein